MQKVNKNVTGVGQQELFLLSGEKGSRVKIPHELVAVRKEFLSIMSLSCCGMRRRKEMMMSEVRRPARNDIVELRVTGLTQGHFQG